MKNTLLAVLCITAIIVITISCSTQNKASSTNSNQTSKLVDNQSPKDAIPMVINDSTTKEILQKKWTLEFSDEFNDNKIDTKKWTIENSTKKRVDITLYSDDNQVEEKEVEVEQGEEVTSETTEEAVAEDKSEEVSEETSEETEAEKE